MGVREAAAQAQRLPGPPFQNGRTDQLFVSDTLYLGADFVYLRASDQVKVWLDTNFAGWEGTLYFYDPKTSQYDSLFTNKTFSRECKPSNKPCAQALNLSARHSINVGDTLHFMYKLLPSFGNPIDREPSWTGPNNNASSLYYSKRVMVNPGPPWPDYGRRHSVAGRVNDSVVEFGFEDEGGTGPNGEQSALQGDYDFTDIVFRVSGLYITLEKVATPVANPPSGSFGQPTLSVTLTDATAGATIWYTLDGSTPDSTKPATRKYSGAIAITDTTTVKAIAYKTGMTPSDIMTAVYKKNLAPSTLQILKADSSVINLGYLTELDAAYKIVVKTNQGGLGPIKPGANTLTAGDQETPTLSNPATSGNFLIYSGNVPLQIAGAAKNDGKTQASLWDTLVVRWQNPSAAWDVVEKRIPIRPAGVNAKAWFAATDGGAAAQQFLISTNTVYIVIKDQAIDPGKTYTAIVSSGQFGVDQESVALHESSPGSGILLGSIPVKQLVDKVSGDGKLQVAAGGDQLTLVYVDPVDRNDTARASAGFDQNVQEVPNLVFTDSTGAPLAPGSIWSPAHGKLYFSYSDDYDNGNLPTKNLLLTLGNTKYGNTIGTDHERIVLDLAPGSSGTRATWTGSIDLKDLFPPADSNAKAETRFRGSATISVLSHDNQGKPDNTPVTSNLIIAYPDQQAALQWKMDTTVTSGEGMIFTVTDQTMTPTQADTVLLTVACTGTGDSVSAFAAIEGSSTSGVFTTGTLKKDEGSPSLTDKVLSCLTTDHIRVRYIDPVYGTLTELVIDEVAKPVADPAGRKFSTYEMVALASATPGATIWYTTDGTTPKPGDGTATVYTAPIRISVNTTLKAIAVKSGMKDSKVMTETYGKQFTASRLEILDENGNALPNGVYTGGSGDIRLRLITTQDGLVTPIIDMNTKVSGDAEHEPIGGFASLGNAFEYNQKMDLESPAAKVAGNFSIEAAGTDTLIARWKNPFDSNDVAIDTAYIKPAFVEAEVYFTSSENGPKVTTYPVDQDSIYIVVKTRPKDPALTYTVTVTTSDVGTDKETLTLKEVSPGVFTAKAPVGTAAKQQGDGTVQVAVAGDQLTAVFTDPVYKTDYRGDAGFARQVQEPAVLTFIDASGNALAPGDVWSPDNGKVYLRYTDDWNAGIDAAVKNKTVRFALDNKRSNAVIGTDAETAVLALKSTSGTKGTWEGSIDLADKAAATKNNGTLESYYRGELLASVTPHDNAGAAATPDAQDNLVIAYPDQPPVIVIRDTSGGDVKRKTDEVAIIIKDQPVSKSGNPTITATVSCAQSGDKVDNVTLVWDGTQYVAKPPVAKGELVSGSPDKSDALLACRETDVLTVTYTDPVYGDPHSADVNWTDDTQPKIYFGNAKDGTPITLITDLTDGDFKVFVEGKSPSRDKVDTILVTLTTDQGEKETVKAIETGAFTGKYEVQVDFAFGTVKPTAGDGKFQAQIDPNQALNQVIATGAVTIGGAEVKANLTLLSAYDRVALGYAKDEDGDGRADHLYFVFDHKLSAKPDGLPEAYWNAVGAGFKQKASAAQLSFVDGDSAKLVADFSKSQFGLGLTALGSPAPYALFPDDNLFGAQKAPLADSVGPVPLTAVKRPSNGQTYAVTETERRFNPDTLVITVSEKLKTSTTFLGMFRFSKGCRDYSESEPLKLYSLPEASADGLTYTVIVDNSIDTKSPSVDDCIFLEGDGRFTDAFSNRPGKLGAPLTGADPKLVIHAFKGYPPVAGVDGNNPVFTTVNQDRFGDKVFRTETGADNHPEVVWIPPYGFDEKDPVGSLERIARDFNNPGAGDRGTEMTYQHVLPTDISTVQVITTTAYLAKITIYDNLGNFVRSMTQAFGRNGELKNTYRGANGGQASFLVWDMKDSHGTKVGQGVYVWKVAFSFQDKNQRSEVRYTRTGVLRN
jgi:hypothetical protein